MYAIRFTVKRKSEQRSKGRYTYLNDRGCVMNSPNLISASKAERFATHEEAVERLCDFIRTSGWATNMWIKNPQIVDIY